MIIFWFLVVFIIRWGCLRMWLWVLVFFRWWWWMWMRVLMWIFVIGCRMRGFFFKWILKLGLLWCESFWILRFGVSICLWCRLWIEVCFFWLGVLRCWFSCWMWMIMILWWNFVIFLLFCVMFWWMRMFKWVLWWFCLLWLM